MEVAEIDRRLLEADKSYHVAVISQVLMDLLTEDESLTFADLEIRYRTLRSPTYLIAIPVSEIPEGFVARRRGKGGTSLPANHYLWIDLHGEAEQNEHLANLGADVDSNLAALRECGVLAKLVYE